MTLDQLRYFVEVARNQHLGKAAKVLGISPSALSHSIAQLESSLGSDLFVRQRNRIHLSDAGRTLLVRSVKLLEDAQRIKNEMAGAPKESGGHLRVGAPPALISEWVVPAWNRFNRLHKDATAEFHTLGSRLIFEYLSEGSLDLGITWGGAAHPQIDSEVLREERLDFAVKAKHPLLSERPERRPGLISSFAACAPFSAGDIVMPLPHPEMVALGIKPKVDFLFDNYSVAVARVSSTQSWTLLPESVLSGVRGVALLELPGWKAKTVIRASFSRGFASEGLRKDFVDYLRKER